MRLACLYCETEEADQVEEIPVGWVDVAEWAMPYRKDARIWWTHVGICPACNKEGMDQC